MGTTTLGLRDSAAGVETALVEVVEVVAVLAALVSDPRCLRTAASAGGEDQDQRGQDGHGEGSLGHKKSGSVAGATEELRSDPFQDRGVDVEIRVNGADVVRFFKRVD